ncbi:hypothetical protein ACIQVE_02440 [Pseudomonas sp. NPDC098747]|uniref:hypothetical protein n=1 Tax=Pseudomonas sp. NPDC098747 TaxID=3364487 RepID=UPI00383A5F64
MSNLSKQVPKALMIKEANGLEISMRDVPNGATAVIPKPDREYDRDFIQLLVGEHKAEHFLGDVQDRTYEFSVPKEWLLDSAGEEKPLVFTYVLFVAGTNPWSSEPIAYKITH